MVSSGFTVMKYRVKVKAKSKGISDLKEEDFLVFKGFKTFGNED